MRFYRAITIASLILVAMCGTGSAAEREFGWVKGNAVTENGVPLSGGQVRLYDAAAGSPFRHDHWRTADHNIFLRDDGTFSARVLAGKYYIAVVKKEIPGMPSLPPAAGDLVYPPWEGDVTPIAVEAGGSIDLGTMSVVPFRKEWTARSPTGVEGTVLDASGKPAEGVLVMAAASPTGGKPVFIADERTGRDGRFVLRTPAGGRYYVRAWGPSFFVVPIDVTAGAFTGIVLRPPQPDRPVRAGSAGRSEVCPSEDFDRIIAGKTGCLVMKRTGYSGTLPPRAMLVWLHGDKPAGGGVDYIYRTAEKAVASVANEGVMGVSLLRPGFYDEQGLYSSGNNYRRIDTYTAENAAELGAAVERLKARFKPVKVFFVGDSGGSALAALLLGMNPGIADGAILASCPCDVSTWREGFVPPWPRSEDPMQWAGAIPASAKIIAITGSADTNTVPALAEAFVSRLKARGMDAVLQIVPGASHSSIIGSGAVTDAIVRLVADVPKTSP